MRLVQGSKRLADPFAELAHEGRGLGRDHRNLSVLLPQAGGDLEPDETAAENDGADAPTHVGEDRGSVLAAPKHVNARQIRARNIEALGNAAGRYQRGIVDQRPPVGQDDIAPGHVHTRDFGFDPLDGSSLVEFFRTQERRLARAHLPRDDEFAEASAIERQAGLRADQHDAAAKSELPQRRRRGRACGAGADDQQRPLFG